LGLYWAGVKTVFANEIDLNASSTYAKNLKHKPVCRSIRLLDPKSIPEVDMFVGGFPCQPFSYSGKRRGLTDTRGTLFYDLATLIKEKEPKYLLLENVPGLQIHDKSRTFQTILDILDDLNYRVFYKILNACDFGVPQVRRRLFIVGVSKVLADGRQFIFPQQFSRKIGVKEAIDDLIDNVSVANNEPMQHRKNTILRFSKIPPGGTWKDVPEEHKPRLRGDPTKITHKNLRFQSHQRLHPDEPCFTITANVQTHFIHYSQNRNLTPREAARLQSFPDWFEFSGKRSFMSWDKDLCQYQQIGNAVPPLLGRALGRALVGFIKGT
jgi:DNA (cytosine-5)-methyltransferase 1